MLHALDKVSCELNKTSRKKFGESFKYVLKCFSQWQDDASPPPVLLLDRGDFEAGVRPFPTFQNQC